MSKQDLSKRDFFAHSKPGADRRDWQTLAQHLAGVARLTRERAAKFDAGEWGALAGLLHDLGKYSPEFQARLAGDVARVNHSTAGAKLAAERYGRLGKLAAFCIAGHHAGLANGEESSVRLS